jgi:hypothetical protein
METINHHKYLKLSALVNWICAAMSISLVGWSTAIPKFPRNNGAQSCK